MRNSFSRSLVIVACKNTFNRSISFCWVEIFINLYGTELFNKHTPCHNSNVLIFIKLGIEMEKKVHIRNPPCNAGALACQEIAFQSNFSFIWKCIWNISHISWLNIWWPFSVHFFLSYFGWILCWFCILFRHEMLLISLWSKLNFVD